jgi:hypothetical protein
MIENLYKKKVYFIVLALFNLILVVSFANFFPFGNPTHKVITESFRGQIGTWEKDVILHDIINRPYKLGEEFIFAPHWGDQVQYMRMSQGKTAKPPFMFRPIFPKIVKISIKLEGFILKHLSSKHYKEFNNPENAYRISQLNFWMLNFVCLIVSAFFLYKIIDYFTNDLVLQLVGLMLFISQFSIIQTVSFAMIDVFSFLVFNVTFYALLKRRIMVLALMLIISVLTKESMVIWTPALFMMFLETRDKRLLFLSVLPILVFILCRNYMGYPFLHVGYHWNVSQGEVNLRCVQKHLGSAWGIICQILGMFQAFGILWIYLPKFRVLVRYKLTMFFLTFFILIHIAEIVLSTHIARVIAPIYPVFLLIPIIMYSKENTAITHS